LRRAIFSLVGRSRSTERMKRGFLTKKNVKKEAKKAGVSEGQLAPSLVREIKFDQATLDSLRRICSTSTPPFEASELYSPASETKFIDTTKRVSQFRLHRSAEVFELAEQLARDISASDENYFYSVVHNDVSEIRYGKGGFFRAHTDFLSCTSNCVVEFTGLFCVTPDEAAGQCRGGETVVYGNGMKMRSRATTIPGEGLVFRKDLKHEGLEVSEGEKHILSVNLWATRKVSTAQILLVTFDQTSGAAAGSESTDTLAAVADGPWYAINVGDCTGFLASHVAWANMQADERGASRPEIVRYNCPDFDSVAFGTVFRIMIGCYVTAAELLEHSDAIDFFAPSKVENVLVSLDIDSPVLEKLAASSSASASLTCEKCGKDGASRCARCKGGCFCSVECFQALFAQHKDACDAKHAQSSAAVTAAGTVDQASEDCGEVVVCDSTERTSVVAAVAQRLDLDWIKFKVVFVEGSADFGQFEGKLLPMMAAWVSVGDYDNILLSRSIFQRKDCAKSLTIEQILRTKEFRMPPEEHREKLGMDSDEGGFRCSEALEWDPLDISWGYERENEMDYDLDVGCFYYGLELAERGPGGEIAQNTTSQGTMPKKVEKNIVRTILEHDQPYPHYPCVVLPGGNDSTSPVSNSSLYHRDSHGKTCFSKEEAARASEHLAAMQFDERVKECLQKRRFNLPQEKHAPEIFWCNEQVYGNINILSVTGLVRMSPGADAWTFERAQREERMPATKKFDAWPRVPSTIYTVKGMPLDDFW